MGKEHLRILLTDAVASIIRLAKECGIGLELPTENYIVSWFEQTSPTHESSREETRSEPRFQNLERHFLETIQSDERVIAFKREALRFAEKYHPGKFWSPFWSPERTVNSLVVIYFNQVKSLKIDSSEIERLCSEYIDDLKSSDASVLTIYRIEDLSAPTAFALKNGINFRPVNEKDIDKYCRENPLRRTQWPCLNKKDWILEIECSGPKETTKTFNDHGAISEHIINALRLSTSGRAIFTLLSNSYKSPFLNFGEAHGGNFVATSRSPGKVQLEAKDLERFRQLYSAICLVETNPSLKDLRLPLRRLHISSSRTDAEDHLVDVVIGLERLLASDTKTGEIGFRFRLRGAALLSDSFGSVAERIDLMNKFYSLRSNVVHGDIKESIANEYAPRAEEALKEIVRWYLSRIDTFSNLKKIMKELDEQCAVGAYNWAHP